ncbi:MAG TPA: 16S/23S rRNA (cytidine-2'-O)-methyltransferase [Acidimicrobiaceae bacterium]|nr:16S/23S rRNA (cytidine-2'-O)-methyltransferase [Acidimicrobiaceae bacterium]
MATRRARLDRELVRRGLCADPAAAWTLIDDGRVLVGGAPAPNAGRLVSAAEPVVVADADADYASRGGHKLAAALDGFAVDPAGKRVLDAGASAGGFTDCLLRRGAARVYAVDVGRGQLLSRLADDPRVVVMDRCNVRRLAPSDIDSPVELLTADLAFISLRTVMASLAGLTAPGGDAVLLVKPQFEVARADADRGGGVVTDGALVRRTVDDVARCAAEHGLEPCAEMESPLRGAAGNVEVFVHARRRAGAGEPAGAP